MFTEEPFYEGSLIKAVAPSSISFERAINFTLISNQKENQYHIYQIHSIVAYQK